MGYLTYNKGETCFWCYTKYSQHAHVVPVWVTQLGPKRLTMGSVLCPNI